MKNNNTNATYFSTYNCIIDVTSLSKPGFAVNVPVFILVLLAAEVHPAAGHL
jgi:hypothetical protein